ncbi:MAG: class D sortase [Bryobacteraceae bacterium]
MRVLIPRKTARNLLLWMQRLFLTCSVTALGYCGFVMADSWAFQLREERQLASFLAAHPASRPVAHPAPRPVTASGLIGRLEIKRLGLSVIVVEGTTPAALRRAVGHIEDTALPGQPGHVGIAGHRDTFFRPLRDIRQGDMISFTTPSGAFLYRVVSTTITSPTDVAIIEPTLTQVLTLVTCYPFNFVGSAPERFIVRAERII